MNFNRREFLKSFALSIGAIAVAPLVKIRDVFAAEHVKLDAPVVVALKYVEDADAAVKAKDPKVAGRKNKKAYCSNCQYYQSDDAKAKTAPCTLMGGAEVNAQGWCASWSEKPKASKKKA